MGSLRVSVAAATAVVGYDLLKEERQQVVSYDRVIWGLMLTGSAAAGDTVIELYVEDVLVGTYANTATGEGNINSDLQPISDLYVPAGSKIHAIVKDAPSTNPIILKLFWDEVEG
jgi:hypothetical protein